MIISDFKTSVNLYFTDTSEFDRRPLAENEEYSIVGWMWRKPEPGQTLLSEFTSSWMQFEFVSVSPCGDPPDMFFAKVKPINQKQK